MLTIRQLGTALILPACVSVFAVPINAQIQMRRPGNGSVSVTPDGASDSYYKGSTGHMLEFLVHNTGESAGSFTLSCSSSGGITCVGSPEPSSVQLDPDESELVEVTFNVGSSGGRVTLSATGSASDDGYYNITALPGPGVTIDLSPHNTDYQDLARCAEGCFAATYAHATVPYFSMDTPRNVTLVYHGDRVDPKPFIHIDVKHGGTTQDLPDTLHFKAELDETQITFLNGETQLRFDAPTDLDWYRIGGQFEVDESTGVYDLEISVGADYGSYGIQWTTVTTQLIIVNENTSPIARGWTVGGVQRAYAQSDGSMLITDGTGSAVYFEKDGSDFTTPDGDFSSLVSITGGHKRQYRDSSYVQFNSSGRMTDVYDRYGNRTQFAYHANGRLETITDPNSKQLVLKYGALGLDTIRSSITPYRSTVVTVASDTTLSAITDPDGESTSFAYDADKRLSTITDRRGNATKLAYHSDSSASSNKVAADTLPAVPISGSGTVSPVETYAPWQQVGVPYRGTLGSPKALTKADSVYGEVTDPGGHTTKFTVNHWGQPLRVVNALSDTTTVTYDSDGLRVRTDYPTGAIDSTEYNANGMPTWVRTADSVITEFTYHATWVTMPASEYGTGRPTTTFWINSGDGWVDSVQAGLAGTTRYFHNSTGRVDSVVDALDERIVHNVYSGTNSNLSEVRRPGDRGRVLGYDSYGRVTSDSTVGLPERLVGYDAVNRLLWVDDAVNDSVTRFTYDALFLTRVKDPANQEYEFGYNALGWTTWREDPTNKRDSLFYDLDGNLVEWQNRRGQTISAAYDVLHRLEKRWGSDTTYTPTDSITYHTAPGTNWVAIHNRNATETTYLHPGGLVDSVTSVLGGHTHTLRYRRTARGQVDSLWATSSSASFMGRRYVHNAGLGMVEEIRMGGKSVEMAFDDKLRPDSIVFEGGDVRTLGVLSWDAVGEVAIDDEDLNDNLARKLDYDAVGRIHGQFTAPNPVERGHFLQYDELGRILLDSLATVESDNCTWDDDDGWVCPPATTDSTHRYVWDEIGNLDSLLFDATTATGTYGAGNRISAFGDCTYATDDDGNVTSRSCTGESPDTLTWSIDNRLVRIARDSTLEIKFFYDAAGRLVRRDEDGTSTYFLWNGNELFAELNSSGIDLVEYSYYGGLDTPHAVGIGDTVYFAHQDGFGNVIGLVSDSKHLRATYGYSLWGEEISATENLQGKMNRARFKGALWMGEEGPELYYMRARWYEPRSGRFLSEDPVGLAGGINPYMFGGDDPANSSDPTGLFDARDWRGDFGRSREDLDEDFWNLLRDTDSYPILDGPDGLPSPWEDEGSPGGLGPDPSLEPTPKDCLRQAMGAALIIAVDFGPGKYLLKGGKGLFKLGAALWRRRGLRRMVQDFDPLIGVAAQAEVIGQRGQLHNFTHAVGGSPSGWAQTEAATSGFGAIGDLLPGSVGEFAVGMIPGVSGAIAGVKAGQTCLRAF